MPETKKELVGNGSLRTKRFLNKSPILTLPAVRKGLHLNHPDFETLEPPISLNQLLS